MNAITDVEQIQIILFYKFVYYLRLIKCIDWFVDQASLVCPSKAAALTIA